MHELWGAQFNAAPSPQASRSCLPSDPKKSPATASAELTSPTLVSHLCWHFAGEPYLPTPNSSAIHSLRTIHFQGVPRVSRLSPQRAGTTGLPAPRPQPTPDVSCPCPELRIKLCKEPTGRGAVNRTAAVVKAPVSPGDGQRAEDGGAGGCGGLGCPGAGRGGRDV